MDPRTALKSFKRLEQERKENTKLNYQFKVAKKIAIGLQLDTRLIKLEYNSLKDERPELFMEAIRGLSGHEFPEGLFIDQGHPTKFAVLAKSAQTSYWFKEFLKLASQYELQAAGLVFPLMGMNDWVIHNYSITMTPGKVRLMIPSASGTLNNVHITSLQTFLEEYKV